MTMITPSYLGETIEYSSLHACRSTLEDPTHTMPISEGVFTLSMSSPSLIRSRRLKPISKSRSRKIPVSLSLTRDWRTLTSTWRLRELCKGIRPTGQPRTR